MIQMKEESGKVCMIEIQHITYHRICSLNLFPSMFILKVNVMFAFIDMFYVQYNIKLNNYFCFT